MWRSSIMNNPNPNYIKWDLIAKLDGTGYYVRCVQTGHFLDGGPDHMFRGALNQHHQHDWLTWNLIRKEFSGVICYFLKCKANGLYLDGGPKHIYNGQLANHPQHEWLLWNIIF